MTKLLEHALEIVRRQWPDLQDAIAKAMLDMSEGDAGDVIEAEHRAAIAEGLAEIERGDYASDEDVRRAIASFGT